MKASKQKFAIIVAVVIAFVLFAYFGAGSSVKSARQMRFGIDIRGGVEAIFEPKDLDRKPTEKELETSRNVIESRLDAKNITDREVTVDNDSGYIIVRFPWKSDETNFNPEEAISELGEIAKLSFRDPDGNILLEGKNVIDSTAEQDTSGVKPNYFVSLTFDSKGAKLFQEATGKLVGQSMGIYMDEEMISNPTVNSEISGGKAVIDNMESFEAAKDLSEKINAGALPFSLQTTSFSTISPTLGANALNVMLAAGLIAFVVICLFMLFYYKLPGAIACLTLVLQMALQLLSISIPQYTLTLPGIAGIILSLGMAVDANIIISERISEELRNGMTPTSAVIRGYKSAFSSVLDGNVTSAIVAGILMIFGSGAMLSFGYTLIAGMIINVFVGVTVSKHALLSVLKFDKLDNIKYFREKKEKKPILFYQKKKYFAIITLGIFLLGIGGFVFRGVKLDTQFTGGAVLRYNITSELDTSNVKEIVSEKTDRPVTVQVTEGNQKGADCLVLTFAGTDGMSPEQQKQVTEAVTGIEGVSDATLSETYVVEPYIGAKALKNSAIAIGLSFLFIVLYVWIRFSVLSGLSAGLTALTALIHDVCVVVFAFVLFGIPLNDAFVAVILTIIGYSINDTIVLYDRIRENRTKDSQASVTDLVNASITQTLARSVNTSLTTGVCVLIILVASWIFHIDSIREFSLPMFFGLISGCYSSVCIAGVLWAGWRRRRS